MSKSSLAVNDPELYRRMSEPFDSVEEVTQAYGDFWDELRAIREKYGIPDVAFVSAVNLLQEGKEVTIVCSGHVGNVSRNAEMLAVALGRAKREREDTLKALVDGTDDLVSEDANP